MKAFCVNRQGISVDQRRGLAKKESAAEESKLLTGVKFSQILKLSPQEQLAVAFGFENLNPPATILLE